MPEGCKKDVLALREFRLLKLGPWSIDLDIAYPSHVCEAPAPATKTEDSEPEENSTLDPMGETVENFLFFLQGGLLALLPCARVVLIVLG